MKSFFIAFFILFTGGLMLYVSVNKLSVDKFNKIILVSDNKIIFTMENKNIVVIGNNLLLSYFDKEEFQIVGEINKIEIIN